MYSCDHVQVKTVPTGLGGQVGNKGGVVLTMRLSGRRLCFICTHLAAHEGAKFREARKMNASEILKNARVPPFPNANLITAFPSDPHLLHHHTFWAGDVNYRLDLTLSIPHSSGWPHPKTWRHLHSLVEVSVPSRHVQI